MSESAVADSGAHPRASGRASAVPDPSGASRGRHPGPTLRPYQEAAARAARAHWARQARLPADDRTAPMIVLPTGTGKTIAALSQVYAAASKGFRALWIGHTDELVHQPLAEYVGLWGGDAGGVKAERDECHRQVVFASRQTIQSAGRLARILAHGVPRLVVVDEAHHAIPGSTYGDILAQVDAAADAGGGPRPLRLGLTATPERSDGVSLREWWRIVSHYPIGRAVDDGYLVPWRHEVERLPDLDLSRIRPGAGGEFDPAELGAALMMAEVVAHTVAVMRRVCWDRLTMVFCSTVEQATKTAKALTSAGLLSAVVSDKTPPGQRRDILARFRRGEIRAVANVRALTEGTDIPPVSAVVLAAGIRSPSLYRQAVGRGLRLSERTGKQDCVVVDIAGVSEEFGLAMAPCLLEDGEGRDPDSRGIVTLATLGAAFGPGAGGCDVVEVRGGTPAWYGGIVEGDRVLAVAGVAVGSVAGTCREFARHQGAAGVAVAVLRGAADVLLAVDVPVWAVDRNVLEGLRAARERPRYAWVRIPGLDRDCYALDCGGRGGVVLAVESAPGAADSWRICRWPPRPDGERTRPPPEDLAAGPVPWEVAEGIGGDVARRADARQGLIGAGAPWRRGPVTAGQASVLRRFGGGVDLAGGFIGAEGPIRTAGQAAAEITRQRLLSDVPRLGLAFRTAPSRRREGPP